MSTAQPARALSQPIVLTLPYPISANRYWRSFTAGKRAIVTVSKEAEAYKTAVNLLCWQAGVREPIEGRVAVAVQLYPHRPLDWAKRQRLLGVAWDDGVQCLDLDNANKVLLDAIKGIAIEDDKWVRKLSSERMEPDGEARVVVTITPLALPVVQAELLEVA
jgi:crossover junction endodeoxyribonuclease RusA